MRLYIVALFSFLLVACGGTETGSRSDNDNSVVDAAPDNGNGETNPGNGDDETNSDNGNSETIPDEPELPVIPSDCEISIKASSEDGDNVGKNLLDGDLNTRWSADGVGETARIDLCDYVTINAVDIALFKGDERSSTFSIEVSNDDSNWVTALTKTTSDKASADIETYSFDKITARFIRYTGYGNSDSNWNSVTVFDVVECTGADCDPIYPVEPEKPTEPQETVEGCEAEGKISYNGACEEWSEVYEPEYGVLGDEDHITANSPIEMTFDALAAQHVTPNGNGWRHELKIKSSGGYRVAMTEVYELFKAKITANLSDGSKTIVAQHHAGDTGTITKLYIADLDESGFENAPNGDKSDSKELNGIFDVYIRLAKEDGSGETKHLLTKIRSGESFDFELENDHGYITVKINGTSLSPIAIEDDSASYFKFGNYLQAQDPDTGDKLASGDADGDWADFYNDHFTESDIRFSNMSYIRTVD